MTTGQEGNRRFDLNIADTQLGVKVKTPKVAVGFLEIGAAATYSFADLEEKDKKVPTASLKRLNATVTFKDILLRGKFELEPRERKLHYSKKFRLPFVNTDLLKLRLTAAWPSAEAAGGLLGRGLGVTVSLAPPERLHRSGLVRQAPEYTLQLAPRLGPPQALYDMIGFPGSVFVKTNATLHVTDAPNPAGLRGRLDVHRATAVVRLYDAARIKPCRLGRNLGSAARALALEDAGAGARAARAGVPAWPEEQEARRGRAAGKAASLEEEYEPYEPDVIDKAAAKAREWAHAVLVNSCVATQQLREQAAEAGQRLRAALEGKRGGAAGADAGAAGATASK